MTDLILRVGAILLMVGIMIGAGRTAWWLASAWFPQTGVVPLSVQPFEVWHGDKLDREEGKHLALRLIKQVNRIHAVMSADLSSLGSSDEVRIESLLPKSMRLASDVPVKMDVEVKPFDVDVVGIFERIYRLFDRSDRLQGTMWSSGPIKLFAALNTDEQNRAIGPWWVERKDDEQAMVDRLAHLYTLDLYKTQVKGLEELDAENFATFVDGLRSYQTYARRKHASAAAADANLLKKATEDFQKIVDNQKASALVYSYLGSVRSLQDDGKAALAAYERAAALNPDDGGTERALNRVKQALVLQRVPIATGPVGGTLAELQAQKLLGYDAAALPPALKEITVAIVATGISAALSQVLGPRLLHAISVVPAEPDSVDYQGHGTSVASLVAALAPSAKIISIKALSKDGFGTNDIIAVGIRRATAEGATIILVPLGGSEGSKTIEDAVAEARKAGALVIAPAGNDGSERPEYPASYPGVMALGAVDGADKLASFSNRRLDLLCTPGVGILVLGERGSLEKQSGTSFSASIAAAFAAVVWAAKPESSADQIRQRLISTAVELGPVDPAKPKLGKFRRIDAIAAAH